MNFFNLFSKKREVDRNNTIQFLQSGYEEKIVQLKMENLKLSKESQEFQSLVFSLRRENEQLHNEVQDRQEALLQKKIKKIKQLEEELQSFKAQAELQKQLLANTHEYNIEKIRQENRKLLVKHENLIKKLSEVQTVEKEHDNLEEENIVESTVEEKVAMKSPSKTVSETQDEVVPVEMSNHNDEVIPVEISDSLNDVVTSLYSTIENPKDQEGTEHRFQFFEREDHFEHQHVAKTVNEIKKLIPKDLPSRYRVAEYYEPGWHKYSIEQIHEEHRKIEPLKAQANNPYFGRMDIYNKDSERKTYYVGKKSMGEHVISWKTDAASIYYDKSIGESKYHPTLGTVTLDYLRQIDIDNCKIKRLHPPMQSKNSIDYGLQHALETKRGVDMAEIVATIQKEQNKLIRLPIHEPIIIQGSAGSGKSIIALHRLSYLLYKYPHLKENSVAIFGPNQLFLEHIKKVLPQLGNDKIIQSTFKDFAMEQLSLKNVEMLSYVGEEKEQLIRLKGSMEYKDYLGEYARILLDNFRPWLSQLVYKGQWGEVTVSGVEIALFYESSKIPYAGRRNQMINWLSQQVYGQFESLKQIEKEKVEFLVNYSETARKNLKIGPTPIQQESQIALVVGNGILNQLRLLKTSKLELENLPDLERKKLQRKLTLQQNNIYRDIENVIDDKVEKSLASIQKSIEKDVQRQIQPLLKKWYVMKLSIKEDELIAQQIEKNIKYHQFNYSLKDVIETREISNEIARIRNDLRSNDELDRSIAENEITLEMKQRVEQFIEYKSKKEWYEKITEAIFLHFDLRVDFTEKYPKPINNEYKIDINHVQEVVKSFVDSRMKLTVTDILEKILRDELELVPREILSIEPPKSIQLLKQVYLKTKKRGKLSWLRSEDLSALLYINLLMKDSSYISPLSYLVLDEAQDYMPFEVFIMSSMTSNNAVMLIGDLGQNLNVASPLVDWQSFSSFLQNPYFYELEATYRSTSQIVDVSSQIIRPFSQGKYNLSEQTYRDGKDVRWLTTTKTKWATRIALLIQEIEKSAPQFESIAIITKTLDEAVELQKALSNNLYLPIQTDQRVDSKILLTSSFYSKGLEFDCVIIADLSVYELTDYERKLAYVATSRALHELYILKTAPVKILMG